MCASMLEHLPRQQLRAGLAALGQRLAPGGCLFIVVTRSLFYPARWIWRCEGYQQAELRAALTDAGLTGVRFRRYPWSHAWLNGGNHIVTATVTTTAGPVAGP